MSKCINNELPKGYNYRPLMPWLYIGNSDIEGQGLFTRISLPSGYIMGRSHIKVGDELIREATGAFVNHSINANCIITDMGQLDKPYYYLVSIRDIEAGEELTVDYYKSACANDVLFKLK